MSSRTKLTKVFLIRHGETDWNREQRFQGHIDVPLNDVGREQAKNVGKLVADYLRKEAAAFAPVSAIFSSDLSRAVETADIAAELELLPSLLRLKVPDLREAHLGQAQGLTRQQIEAQFGTDLYFKWKASARITDENVAYPGGESGKMVLARALKGIQTLLHHLHETHPAAEHSVIIVSHGGVLRRVLDHLRGPKNRDFTPIGNGALFLLDYSHSERRLNFIQKI